MTNETKQCKYCQTEIPKKAKVCPNCRKKQNGIVKWVVLAVVVLAVIGAAVGGKGDDEPQKVDNSVSSGNLDTQKAEESQGTAQDEAGDQEIGDGAEAQETEDAAESQEAENGAGAQEAEDAAESQEPEETLFGIGETAELNGVRVTLTNYEESAGSEYNKPSDGNVFVLAEFEIQNDTQADLAVSSMLSFEAYADDYALNYSLGALLEKGESGQLDGTVAAGKKMRGWIGYEAPADWKALELRFTDNVWNDSKFKFEIKK